MSKSLHCSVITPEAAVLECEATSVVFPAHDGEMGILPRRAPLLAKMGVGTLRVTELGGAKHLLFVDGGFAQMLDNRLTLLTEQAVKADKLELEAERAALHEAKKLPGGSKEAVEARSRALARARARVRLASDD